jgi:membrane AbrB-like protein
MTNLLIAIGIGLVAAGIGTKIGLPGAAVVLPILVVTSWNIFFSKQSSPAPPSLQLVAFGLLGTGIGLSIDKSSLESLRTQWPILVFMAISVYVTASIVMIVIARFAHVDLTTAMLAGSPGGLTGVAAVSYSAGANVAQVVAVQTLRLLIVYASLPFLVAALKHVH